MARAIPPRLEPDILTKAGDGWATRRISDWLDAEHQVKASYRTVAKFLERVRDERGQIAPAIAREKLGACITSDLDALEAVRLDAATRRKSAAETSDWKAAADIELRAIHEKLERAGVGGADDQQANVGVVILPAQDPLPIAEAE